jgi:type IV pilus assembly protein PilY1
MFFTSRTRPFPQVLRLGGKMAVGSALSLSVILPAQAFSPLSGPVESTTAVPPNVVILFDNSSSMRWRAEDNTFPADPALERLVIARDVTKQVIRDNSNLRFGLFIFNNTQGSGDSGRDAPGGRLMVPVGEGTSSHITALEQALDALKPNRPDTFTTTALDQFVWTPLAESYYEITRYMRGLNAFYPQRNGVGAPFVSPIQYRCQKNFGLIVTDGLPTYDATFPTNDPDRNNPGVTSSTNNIPNWDGDATGDDVNSNRRVEGSTFYLNDIAKFAYDIDLRNTARTGVVSDNAGKSWDDPAFPKQNMRTFTVGFAVDDPRLRSVASAGNGSYYTARDRASLTAALNQALLEINAAAGSGGGGAVSSAELSTGSLYYRTLYDPENWRGEITASNFDGAGSLGEVVWSTNTTMTPSARAGLYQTVNEASGVVTLGGTTFVSLPEAQRDTLTAAAAVVGTTATGQGLLDWATGATNAAPYRQRTALLGDIINSSPAYADPQEATYLRSDTGYAAYLGRKSTHMVPSLVVGSNDGFLHVLAAREHVQGAATTTAGKHRLALLPSAMHAGLGTRARPDYGRAVGHVSGVDGNIVIADAEIGSLWTTLALTGFGAGGKGLIAARLFDGRVSGDGNQALGGLWEIGPNSSGFSEMGHIYGRPAVGKHNGKWVAITGNGYGSASGQAVLYIIDLADGKPVKSFAVGAKGGNGLSPPRLQLDAAGNVVGAYAGDLKGQMWKFDLAGSDSAKWGAAFTAGSAAAPLFTAAANQPITVAPELYRHPQGGQLVLFGTGKFMESGDLSSIAEQAYYAVWDKPGAAGGLQRSNLLAQSILGETTVRTVSTGRVNWDTQSGWYLPLKVGNTLKGERVTRNSIVRGNRVFFNTGFIDSASTDPCISNANGWLMALDIFSGGSLPTAIFDSNNDGVIDGRDTVTAGLKLDIGLPGDLTFVSRPGSGVLLDGRSELLPSLAGVSRVTTVGQRLPAGLLRPIPRLDEDGKPIPVTGDYLMAGSRLCNPATGSCECPEGSSSCLSAFTRPNCDGGSVLAGGSRDVKLMELRQHCVAKRIAWRQRM